MKLPIGISTFSEIIEGGYVYVDKTAHILNLIENHKYVFLSRPRRFGKSLLCSTIKDVFSGRRELFKGLAIYDRYDFPVHPVIHISFGGVRSLTDLNKMIFANLKENQRRLDIECSEHSMPALCFRELIQKACEKYDKKAVVIIDEYDKPILDNVDQLDVARDIREGLKSFYTEIKENDQYLRFVFLTGVTKFAKVSVFSGLNNLKDISLNANYATICGYTQEELETVFEPFLRGADMERVRDWYNGYNFNGEPVYNPFDILLFISKGFKFDNYWFSTGTPTFLIKLLKEREYFLPELEHLRAGKELIDTFDIEDICLEPLLFQSGYLTLDRIEEEPFGGLSFLLRIPNKEVQISLNDVLLQFFTGERVRIEKKSTLYIALRDGDMEALRQTLFSLYAGIPYNYFIKNNLDKYEGYYASVFYAAIASLGVKIIPEDVTNRGRIDFAIEMKDKIYLIEFKVSEGKEGKEESEGKEAGKGGVKGGGKGGGNGHNDSAHISSPLSQIKEKGYHEKYSGMGKNVYLLGILFDRDERNIGKFEFEEVF